VEMPTLEEGASELEQLEYQRRYVALARKKQQEDPVSGFVYASIEVESDNKASFLLDIRKRYNLVRLWERYLSAESWYRSDSNPNRLAGSVNDARLQLFWAANPPDEGQRTDKKFIKQDLRLRAEFKKFDDNLRAGKHWYSVARGLGYGAMLLMPVSCVSHRLIAHELTDGMMDIWIELVLYVSPWITDMGGAALKTLGPRMLFGNKPFATPLLLEQVNEEEINKGPGCQAPWAWTELFIQRPLLQDVERLGASEEAPCNHAGVMVEPATIFPHDHAVEKIVPLETVCRKENFDTVLYQGLFPGLSDDLCLYNDFLILED
jgi:hypothetical protein